MDTSNTYALTTRELEVVTLIGQGLSCKQIAEHLDITYFTVRKHRSNILFKLQLNSTAQLSAYAVALVVSSIPMNPNLRMPGFL